MSTEVSKRKREEYENSENSDDESDHDISPLVIYPRIDSIDQMTKLVAYLVGVPTDATDDSSLCLEKLPEPMQKHLAGGFADCHDTILENMMKCMGVALTDDSDDEYESNNVDAFTSGINNSTLADDVKKFLIDMGTSSESPKSTKDMRVALRLCVLLESLCWYCENTNTVKRNVWNVRPVMEWKTSVPEDE